MHPNIRSRAACCWASGSCSRPPQGTGIGFAAAKRFAEEGARIFISDLHPKRLAEAAAKISETTGTSTPSRVCDVTQEKDVRELVDAALERMGHIDVLVNNAGLGGSAEIVMMTDEQWSRVLDVTLTSVFRMCRAVLPHMYERGSGVVINNASVLGWRAQAEQAHYAAAKAGVMAFTRCAAIEAAKHGVRVNAVAPSIAMHEFLAKVTPPRAAGGAREARGLRPRCRDLGGRQRDGVPGERSLELHDRRSRAGLEPAGLRDDGDFPLGRGTARCSGPGGRDRPTGSRSSSRGSTPSPLPRTTISGSTSTRRARRAGPFGSTIAHGYLTLSLVNLFLPDLVRVENAKMGVNYGTEKVRFPAAVKVDARIRGRAQVLEATDVPGGVQIVVRVTIEIEGGDRPACVADTISRFYF